MRVQRLVMPDEGRRSWTVVDDDGLPVEPAESDLAYLCALERSPNTVRAYASAPLDPGEHFVEFPPEALWVF